MSNDSDFKEIIWKGRRYLCNVSKGTNPITGETTEDISIFGPDGHLIEENTDLYKHVKNKDKLL